MNGRLVVVGDTLLDVDVEGTTERLCPDAPAPVVDVQRERARPGGAGLAALLAALDGTDVVLVTALGDDPAGERLRGLLAAHVALVVLPDRAPTREKVRIRAGGTSLARLDRGGPGAPDGAGAGERLRQVLQGAAAVLVSDYGGGVTGLGEVREALAGRPHGVPLVWDPHPRGVEPVPGATLVTPNAAEAQRFADVEPGLTGDAAGAAASEVLALAEARAVALTRRWGATAVAVTLGRRGALLSYGDGTPVVAPSPFPAAGDSCGAGDRFATAAAQSLAGGGGLSDALTSAVASATHFVAAGGASAVEAAPAQRSAAEVPVGTQAVAPENVVRRLRARGRTVVATGGCFDILHAGHVATLRAARSLGDSLVVCLNSDASVSRLKGPTRPLVTQDDRARVLEALECVDAVVVFDEDTPEAVLGRLRPDVWAKGGDYADMALPESDLVRSWGGQPVVLPYLDGRSTTGLVTRITAGDVR